MFILFFIWSFIFYGLRMKSLYVPGAFKKRLYKYVKFFVTVWSININFNVSVSDAF